MTPEAQRIAIAVFAGWKIHKRETFRRHRPKQYEYVMLAPDDDCIPLPQFLVDSVDVEECRIFGQNRLPDYLSDLNAIAQAEARLSDSQHSDFRAELWHQLEREMPGAKYHELLRAYQSRTPSQRAECLLRAIGKWGEAT